VTKWHPKPELLAAWLGLLALLGLTVAGAYQPLGSFNTGLAIAIATGKAILIALIFMELRSAHKLIWIFAGAGFFWLGIMLWLTFADYLTRPLPFSGA
jgi:cytochrome c oxidase subunit 4